jgi:hypothetical protein
VDNERAVLPFSLNQPSLSFTPDFDAATTGNCGHAGGTEWDGDDRAAKSVRAVHRGSVSTRQARTDSTLSQEP